MEAAEEVSLGDDVTSGEKAPLGRILRNFRSLWVTFHNVTSGQKVPLRILRNSDCACAHTNSSAKCNGCACARDHFWSGPLPVT